MPTEEQKIIAQEAAKRIELEKRRKRGMMRDKELNKFLVEVIFSK